MTAEGHDTASTAEDELLVRLYRQVTDTQAARYAASYDTDAGLGRFRKLLREHAPADAHQVSGRIVAAAVTAGTDAFPVPSQPVPAELGQDADPALADLYALHYRALVRLASLLVRDVAAAEQVVDDAFIAAREGWHRLRTPEEALAYLRQAVVNRSRSVLRHRAVSGESPRQVPLDLPGGEGAVLFGAERSAVVAALRELPVRQREAVVLRYYGDLSEAEIAGALGISRGAVKSHIARGMAALRAAVEQ